MLRNEASATYETDTSFLLMTEIIKEIKPKAGLTLMVNPAFGYFYYNSLARDSRLSTLD
jgi:hypothetical protein